MPSGTSINSKQLISFMTSANVIWLIFRKRTVHLYSNQRRNRNLGKPPFSRPFTSPFHPSCSSYSCQKGYPRAPLVLFLWSRTRHWSWQSPQPRLCLVVGRCKDDLGEIRLHKEQGRGVRRYRADRHLKHATQTTVSPGLPGYSLREPAEKFKY